jgi:ABC-type antimicrobial peptide transport system permease subunit
MDFDGKEAVEGFIQDYNDQTQREEDQVTYTDIIGTLTSSITSIVDTISYVLIAFVAISLVVSSIMIAIITYISVLERTKEIGVLRALGASKRDVSKIFNAETVIEGFLSGLFGILVTLLLCIPINAIVYYLVEVETIAVLPLAYSLILIAISVLLTLIAGFIPSRMAAKKDPVTALRTE